MNTIENNKIIAKFMNYANGKPLTDGLLNSLYKDWNSIMPVVEKIESIKIENYEVRVDIYLNCCRVAPTHWQELISIYGDKDNKIQVVYKACVEFIKWYNENK